MHGSSLPPLLTLGDLVNHLREFGDTPALGHVRSGDLLIWSSPDLSGKVSRVAAALATMGIGRGDNVPLIASSSPGYVAILLGIVLCGATAMPLDPQLGPTELKRIWEENGCRVAFLEETTLNRAMSSSGAAQVFIVGGDESSPRSWTSLLSAQPEALPPVNANDVALLVYTSGTTGTPKPVPLTHRNVTACVNGLMAGQLIRPGDRTLVPLPLHHIYPLVVGTLAPLAAGACAIFPESLTGPDLRRALQRSEATHLIGVPRLYHAAVQALTSIAKAHAAGRLFLAALRLSDRLTRRTGWPVGKICFFWLRRRFAPRLRTLVSGGAALDPELNRMLEALGWEVLTGYGLTETGPILAFNRRRESRVGTVGRPLDGVMLRISSPDPQGVGEIEAKGPNIFAGYRGNPSATRAAFTDDGWFRTGDLGAIDGDGYLRIVARKSEVIVLPGGKKIDPELLEAAYQESPVVRELGVFMSDGVLLAVLVPDLAKTGAGGHAQVIEALQRTLTGIGASLPSYQRLGGFAVSREPLSRTPVGKIRRHLLPDLYRRLREGRPVAAESALSPQDEALLRDPGARKLWTWLQARYPGRQITLDSNPQLDLGIDSLGWIGLTLEIERAVGVTIDEPTIAHVASIRDLLSAAIASASRRTASEDLAVTAGRLAMSPPWIIRVMRALLIQLDRAVMRLAFSLRVTGAAELPAAGPYLICPNHASFLDPFAMAAALPLRLHRNLCWGGWTGILFTTSWRRLFSRLFGILPIDPAQPARSIALVIAALQAGKSVVWFPEGARSPDGTLQHFPAGTGYILKETSVTVVPVFIAGAYEAWPIHRRWPRPGTLSVTFGKALNPAELNVPFDSERAIVNRLREYIVTLGSNVLQSAESQIGRSTADR